MADKIKPFIGRKNELAQFLHLLSQRPIHAKSRVILICGSPGIGKTTLGHACLQHAKTKLWHTVAVYFGRNTPEDPVQLLDILTMALHGIASDKVLQDVENQVKQTQAQQTKITEFIQDHPEIWQQMLFSTRPVSEQAPPVPDQPPGILTADHSARLRLIAYMVKNHHLPDVKQGMSFDDPAGLLATALSEAYIKTAGRRGLVIWFDGCEYLPPALEVFLRDTFICPTVRKNAKLHFIFSGSVNLFRERSTADLLGTHHRVKGYADQIYDPPPIVWQLERWVDPEVQEYLRKRKLDSGEPEVSAMQQTSRGIPLALELITDVIQLHDMKYALSIFPALVEDDENVDRIVANVIRSFVQNLSHPADTQVLLAMALLLDPEDTALSAVCDLSGGTSETAQHKSGGMVHFIQPDGRMHEAARAFLRDYLWTEAHEVARLLAHKVTLYYQTQLENYADMQVEDRVKDLNWQLLLKNYLNALCWCNEREASILLAQSVLEAWLFSPHFGHSLLTLTHEYTTIPSTWSTDTVSFWQILSQTFHADLWHRLQKLNELSEKCDVFQISAVHNDILKILRAQLYIATEQIEEALKQCASIAEAPLDNSLRNALAAVYGEIGTALGFSAGAAVASEVALHAYQYAAELHPQSSAYQYGLGIALLKGKQFAEAITALTRVINMNSHHENAVYHRGLALLYSEKYAGAVADFTKILNSKTKHAEVLFYRGLCYTHLSEHTAALADLNKAIGLDADMAKAYAVRGSLYADMAQFDKALVDFTRALRLDATLTDAYIERGECYSNLNQVDLALDDFSKALSLNPHLAEAYAKRGSTHAHLEQHESALIDYTKALDLDPALFEVYVQRGDTYAALGCQDSALEDFTHALTGAPNMADAYTKRGTIYNKRGQYENAIADFDRALSLNPHDAEVYAGRGMTHLGLEHYSNAITDFTTALKYNPQLNGLYKQRGYAHLQLGQYSHALTDLAKVVNGNPMDATAHYQHGLANYHLERYESALSDFRQSLLLDPHLIEVYLHRADTHAHLGSQEQALIDYGQAIAVNSQNAAAYYGRGCVYNEMEQYTNAIADFDKAVAINPELAQAYNKRGFAYANLDQNENALADYAQAIVLDPNNTAVYMNRGNTYLRMGDDKKALIDFTQAIKCSPDRAETYFNRGITLTNLGQFDNALLDFTQAITLNPPIAEAYYYRGNTYAKLGRLEDALGDLNQVILQNPQDSTAYNNRGNIYADLEKPDLAIADYSVALDLNPQLAEVYTNRGLTYADIEQYDSALADYRQALTFDPNDAATVYYSGCAFGLLADEMQACAWLEQAIILDETYRTVARNDPDFDAVRHAPCFQAIVKNV